MFSQRDPPPKKRGTPRKGQLTAQEGADYFKTGRHGHAVLRPKYTKF